MLKKLFATLSLSLLIFTTFFSLGIIGVQASSAPTLIAAADKQNSQQIIDKLKRKSFSKFDIGSTLQGGETSSVTDIESFASKATGFMVNMALALATLAIVVAGAYMLFGGLSESGVSKAKTIITGCVIGITIIFIAPGITQLIAPTQLEIENNAGSLSVKNATDANKGLLGDAVTTDASKILNQGIKRESAIDDGKASGNFFITLVGTLTGKLLSYIAIFALFVFVYGGMQMILYAGNEAKATAAHKTLSYGAYGIIISILASTIVNTTKTVIQSAGTDLSASGGGVFANLIATMLSLAGILAVIALIISGLYYVTSGGNDDQAKKGRQAIKWSITGLLVVMFSYTGVSLVTGVGESLADASSGNLASTSIFIWIVTMMLWIIAPIAVLMLIWSGYQYVTAEGDAKKVENAKFTIIYAAIGMVISMLAYTIVSGVTAFF